MGPITNGIATSTFVVVGEVQAAVFLGVDKSTAGDGDNTWGVTTHYGKDEPVAVEPIGIVAVKAGAAITAGQEVQSDAQGRAIPKGAGATVARALDDVAGVGEYVRVMLIPN